jgi:hypothetical protein
MRGFAPVAPACWRHSKLASPAFAHLPLVYRDTPKTGRTRANGVHIEAEKIPAQRTIKRKLAEAVRIAERF